MSIAAKQRARLKTIGKVWSAFEQVQVTDKMRAESPYLKNVHSIFRNTRYLVHCFPITTPIGACMQVDVKRWVEGADVPWEDMQRIKDDIFSPDAVALEMYPAASIAWRSKLTIRVMYVMPTDWVTPFGLHLPTAFGGQA